MKNRKGFTIVELVIVIAVIAILAAVLIPTFTTVTANARASAALSQAKTAQEALLSNTQGSMPEGTLFAVDNDNDVDPEYLFAIKGRSLEQIKVDGGTAPVKAGTETVETVDYDYYNLFVSADVFADSPKGGDKANGMIKYVFDKALSFTGTVNSTANPVGDSQYAIWTYTYNNGTSDVVIRLHVYYNADIATTCVAFLAA